MSFFVKEVDRTDPEAMREFLANHFTYFLMNSWNRLISIANNVKIHKLGLDQDTYSKALDLISAEDASLFHEGISHFIAIFKLNHPGFDVFFNGRSSGYLVLSPDQPPWDSVIPSDVYDDDWDERLDASDLAYYTDLVCDFDQLCDDIRDYLIQCCQNMVVEDQEITYTKTVSTVVYK